MFLTAHRRAQLRLRAKVIGYSVLGGGLYSVFVADASDEAHYFLGFAQGAFIGLFIAGLVVAFNWYWSQTRPGETLRKLPFTAAMVLKTVVYPNPQPSPSSAFAGRGFATRRRRGGTVA